MPAKTQHKVLCNLGRFQKVDFCEILDTYGENVDKAKITTSHGHNDVWQAHQ